MSKRIFSALLATCFLATPAVYADTQPLPMNVVQLTLAKEQWAKTTTARVVVNLSAALQSSGLSDTHKTLYSKLGHISDKGEWHITSFNRYKDASGLEKVNAQAEARLPESELPGLRDRAKKVSRPGETFTIGTIDFTPSLADVQRTRADVRQHIYEQANEELARINKAYGSAGKYFIHSVNFSENQPVPQPMLMKNRMMTVTAEASASADAALVISDKVQMRAVVVIASRND